ncbi:putative head assembly protein [Shigella flexneri]|nr:putative head assembly protein [Shigella flexneri]
MITFKPTRNIDLIEAVGNHPDIIAGSEVAH